MAKAQTVLSFMTRVFKLRLFELSEELYICFLFLLQSVEILQNCTVVVSVPYSITFASWSRKNYDVTEALIAN